MNISTVILAAGKGVRMNSSLPKVLHQLAGKPLLHYVLDTTMQLQPKQVIVVHGYAGEQLQKACTDYAIDWAHQPQQLGTGDAVRMALPYLAQTEHVLILYGDVPLIKADTLLRFINNTPKNALGLLTTVVNDPTGFGRIIRDKAGNIIAIIEEKDATDEQKKICEINPGIYLIPTNKMQEWLSKISSNNKQNELYLTDLVALAYADQVQIYSELVDPYEVQGINSRGQLAILERQYQLKQAESLMAQGVTLLDPSRFDLRGKADIKPDVIIDINVVLEGRVIIDSGVKIGANVIVKDSIIGANTEILPNSIIESANIGVECKIGPFARIRPDTVLHNKVRIGNFVEVKKSNINNCSKANHLSYIGDATIGKDVNIGAGTITCNYDGVNKYQTIIEDNVFIGSDTQLIAPVKVGKGATVAAGTTVLKDVLPQQLALNKKQQQNIEGWRKPSLVKSEE